MLRIKSVTGPALTLGAFDVTFGEFEKLEPGASVSFDNPAASDFVFAAEASVATNVVTVRVRKISTVAVTPAAWADAITTDVAGLRFAIVVDGY